MFSESDLDVIQDIHLGFYRDEVCALLICVDISFEWNVGMKCRNQSQDPWANCGKGWICEFRRYYSTDRDVLAEKMLAR